MLEIEARQLENRERALGVERVRLQNDILQNDPIPRRVNDLGIGERHVVASLFSEGGSNAATFSRDELIRVM